MNGAPIFPDPIVLCPIDPCCPGKGWKGAWYGKIKMGATFEPLFALGLRECEQTPGYNAASAPEATLTDRLKLWALNLDSVDVPGLVIEFEIRSGTGCEGVPLARIEWTPTLDRLTLDRLVQIDDELTQRWEVHGRISSEDGASSVRVGILALVDIAGPPVGLTPGPNVVQV